MKTYEQTASDALIRIKEKKAIRKKMTVGSIAVICLCFIAAGGAFASRGKSNGATVSNIPQADKSEGELYIPEISQENDNTDEENGIFIPFVPDEDSYVGSSEYFIEYEEIEYEEYEGKNVSLSLKERLENESEGIMVIMQPYINPEYVYGGKMLAEYENEAYEERFLPEKLLQLMKDGDSLKYGSAICETGTPDGIVWSKSLYEERLAFYGEKILGKYIKNGEFLTDVLTKDIENAEICDTAQKAYAEAKKAYFESLADTVGKKLESKYCGVSESGVLYAIFAAEEEFESFTIENISKWFFR